MCHGSSGPRTRPSSSRRSRGLRLLLRRALLAAQGPGLAPREGQAPRYVSATREDSALGMAAGAYLGGSRPMVLMQNSGLGVSAQRAGVAHTDVRAPALLLVTWRGEAARTRPSTC